MSLGEKGVFALLAGSIGLGIFQLATSPWGETDSQRQDSSSNSENDAQRIGSSFGHERIMKMGGGRIPATSLTSSELTQDTKQTASLGVDDGIVKVAETVSDPRVNDGVTAIQYGDGPRR